MSASTTRPQWRRRASRCAGFNAPNVTVTAKSRTGESKAPLSLSAPLGTSQAMASATTAKTQKLFTNSLFKVALGPFRTSNRSESVRAPRLIERFDRPFPLPPRPSRRIAFGFAQRRDAHLNSALRQMPRRDIAVAAIVAGTTQDQRRHRAGEAPRRFGQRLRRRAPSIVSTLSRHRSPLAPRRAWLRR